MEKIYCKDLERDILPRECYQAKNEKCSSCSYRIVRIQKLQPSLNNNHHRKTVPAIDADRIRTFYRFIVNLHPSFWQNPKFLRWQLMRLNEQYQRDFDDVSEVYNEFFTANDMIDVVKNVLPEINKLNKDFFPGPNESFEEWSDRLSVERPYEHEFTDLHKLEIWEVYKDENSPFDYIGFRDINGKRLLVSPLTFLQMNPLPIDYLVRFPLPYFLDTLPTWEDKDKKKKVEIRNWALNLFTYEMSQAGVRPIMIAKTIYNENITYKNGKPKEFDQMRVNKRTIAKPIFNSYPLPPLTIR
jgi:hypothetical protein